MDGTITRETLLLLQEGDHEAFETVFTAYFDKVKHFIERIVRSEDEAEELAQDVFVRLWIGRETIDADKSFDTFLFAVSRNAAFNYLKHKQVCENYLNRAAFSEEVPYGGADEMIYAEEIALLVEMTVGRMPEQRQKIYRLSRTEGLDKDEIAERLHISKKTVENQLSLALRELRRVITFFIVFFS